MIRLSVVKALTIRTLEFEKNEVFVDRESYTAFDHLECMVLSRSCWCCQNHLACNRIAVYDLWLAIKSSTYVMACFELVS